LTVSGEVSGASPIARILQLLTEARDCKLGAQSPARLRAMMQHRWKSLIPETPNHQRLNKARNIKLIDQRAEKVRWVQSGAETSRQPSATRRKPENKRPRPR